MFTATVKTGKHNQACKVLLLFYMHAKYIKKGRGFGHPVTPIIFKPVPIAADAYGVMLNDLHLLLSGSQSELT